MKRITKPFLKVWRTVIAMLAVTVFLVFLSIGWVAFGLLAALYWASGLGNWKLARWNAYTNLDDALDIYTQYK